MALGWLLADPPPAQAPTQPGETVIPLPNSVEKVTGVAAGGFTGRIVGGVVDTGGVVVGVVGQTIIKKKPSVPKEKGSGNQAKNVPNGQPSSTPNSGNLPKYSVPSVPNNPANSPGSDWVWRGKPGEPAGGDKGAWFNPKTGETLHPDLGHGGKVGSHWDWRDADGNYWRLLPGGKIEQRGIQ